MSRRRILKPGEEFKVAPAPEPIEGSATQGMRVGQIMLGSRPSGHVTSISSTATTETIGLGVDVSPASVELSGQVDLVVQINEEAYCNWQQCFHSDNQMEFTIYDSAHTITFVGFITHLSLSIDVLAFGGSDNYSMEVSVMTHGSIRLLPRSGRG